MWPKNSVEHPRFTRRHLIEAGTIGLLGLGTNHVQQLLAETDRQDSSAKSVIFIFLSGGLAQHESFDLKPHSPAEIRGEFNPIATQSPGLQICEHLPKLAARSNKWALVRSLTHPYNEHSVGHMVMLSGRTALPTGFNSSKPQPQDHPSIAAIAGQVALPRDNLPTAIVLPEKLVHRSGRVIPGQFAGAMGPRQDPYFLECCQYNPTSYGAWPEYGFNHARGEENPDGIAFRAPSLSLPESLGNKRWQDRSKVYAQLNRQQRELGRLAELESLDKFQELAISMLTDGKLRHAFDVVNAKDKQLDRYGQHVFGWSLLMAKRLVETGVNLVQVNLGNNETWDTHGNAFPHLKNYLLPPMDQSVSALLDDLDACGLLDSTLVVMAGEFGRTPKITHLKDSYALPGRDHWGAVQSVLLAGGGIQGGAVIGSSDEIGGYPKDDPQQPENLAATIYEALGLPRNATWHDLLDRPAPVYHGEPIRGLT